MVVKKSFVENDLVKNCFDGIYCSSIEAEAPNFRKNKAQTEGQNVNLFKISLFNLAHWGHVSVNTTYELSMSLHLTIIS